jgi:hypothetical protein
MIVPDVEVREQVVGEPLLQGGAVHQVIGVDTGQDLDRPSDLIQWNFSGVLAGEFHRPALAEGHDQGPILHALVRHPADLLHEAQRLLKMRKHLGTHPRLFPFPVEKGQDVEIMTKKVFVCKEISANLITGMMQWY